MPKYTKILAVTTLLLLAQCPVLLAAGEEALGRATSELVGQAEAYRDAIKRKPLPDFEGKPDVIAEEKEEAFIGEDKGPFFFIREIHFEGNTLFSEDDFEKYTSQFTNRETSFIQLRNLAKMITNHYRAQGFISSRAYIPPQRVQESSVTVKIIEGRIGQILVEGNKYFASHLYTAPFRFQKDNVLQFQEIEKSLYILNQKPDRKARAYLIAGEQPTTSDLILKAEETFPLHVYYEFNNRGTKLTHRSRHLIHVDNNNFMGQGDILNTNFQMAEEGAITAGAFDYSMPIERTGTTLNLDGSYSESMLIGHLKPAEVKGESLAVKPGITQSFIKTPQFSLDGSLAFEFKESKTLVDDFKANFDRLRILRLGPRMASQDVTGRTVFSADFNWGIPDFLGSNGEVDEKSSRPNSGGEFIYYTANLARIQRLPWASFLVARAGGQLTKDNLPSPEQFRAGGAFSVRGYPEADSIGDYGYNFSAELNIPVPFLPKEWQVPFNKKTWYEAVRLVGFLDGGKTFIREKAFEEAVKDRFLLGTGFGVRMNLDRTFSMQADFGWPIGDDSTDEDSMQTHLSLQAGF